MDIIKEPDFRTWDLGELPGTPQNDKTQSAIDDQLINRPNEPAGETGESFNEFSRRVIAAITKVIEEAPDNTVVVTHNSVFGLIHLWDSKGRPKYLDKPFRTAYTKQGSDTGEHYTIKGKNGTIYVCRHGETEDNKDGNFRKDDVDLTKKGKQEAVQLGEELSDVEIAQLISSPLPRAIETSQTILNGQKEDSLEEPVEDDYEEEEEETPEEEASESEEEEEEIEQKIEPEMESGSDMKKAAEFIDCIMTGAAIAHKMHLRVTGTGSYAMHKALNELYDFLPEHADAIAEAYQGKMGMVLPDADEVDQSEYLAMTPLQYVEYLIKDVSEDRIVFGDCSAMQSLVDNLMVDLYGVRYKLKLLS